MIYVVHDYNPQSGFLAWLSFPANTKPEDARQQFQERYGHRPHAIIRKGPLLCVGPLDEREGPILDVARFPASEDDESESETR